MRDPFAFMGAGRGSGREGEEVREKSTSLLVFDVPSDLDLVRAAWLLLGELNELTGPRRSDAVIGLCRYHGFECPPVTQGLWALFYNGGRKPVAYLYEGARFDLFILVEGVTVS